MHIIIIGCGRVGSTLARQLDTEGHDVVVIDRKQDSFRRLGNEFGGRTIKGVGFDRDVLVSAGISPKSGVMAVTSGDNSNIMVARVARELFGVERVVARIYDPKRALVYERLGIPTVATVAWTSNRILSTILPSVGDVQWTDPTATFELLERRVDAALAGTTISGLPVHVALLTRNGHIDVPDDTTLLQEGDVIHTVGTRQQHADFTQLAHGGLE
jgi:trk system potassium uptake protein